jgi:hypothetical protein
MDRMEIKIEEGECNLCDGTGRLSIIRQLADGSCEPDDMPCDCFLDIHGVEDTSGEEEEYLDIDCDAQAGTIGMEGDE